ncbi:MAG: hypothetical protein CVV48_01790 [Spirochaetae bacterium HGW-Spirochaetae-4]|jgi:hypothetical protein|nr:MAG: hypothetical protein CVV48_01790 [Spirochaetae bacterium HGW-Spirochaetae-4]
MDYQKYLSNFLDYCKSEITITEWNRRFSNCENNYIYLKENPIFLAEKESNSRTFISPQYLTKDVPMWYLYNIFNFIHNPEMCDLGLLARTLPKILRISEQLPKFITQKGFTGKMKDLLHLNNINFENTIFELLVGGLYLRNGATNIEFLFDKSKKLADIHADYYGFLYIECKRRTKESEYSRKERELWYQQYLPIQDYLTEHQKSLVIKITFHHELNTYPKNYLYDLLKPMIDGKSRYGLVYDNEDITIEFNEPDFQGLNEKPANKWKIYSPTFTRRLFGLDDERYGITMCVYSNRNRITDYVSDVKKANAGIWYCDSIEAIRNKSVSFKKNIVRALSQIPNEQVGSVHICYESYNGAEVESMNYNRILSDLKNFDLRNKKINFIYLHNLRLLLPENEIFDCIETVVPITNDNSNLKQKLLNPQIICF